MAQVTLPYTLTPGTPENVNNLMSNLTALRDGVNTIDTAQIAAGAVTSAKLASGAVDATALAANAVTSAKLAAALADNLGISNGSNTRKASTGLISTETTTTSTSWADVTSGSVTLDVASNSWVCLYVTGEFRAYDTAFKLRALASTNSVGLGSVRLDDTADYVLFQKGSFPNDNSTYNRLNAFTTAGSDAIGTGSQTIKLQIASTGAGQSSRLKNFRFTVVNWVY